MMILMKRCLTLCLALSLLLSLLVPVRAEGTQTKRTLTAEDLTLTCVKVYDDNDVAQPEIRIANLGEDQVFVQYEQARYDNPYVGTQKTVAVTGLTLTGEDAGNYTLGDLTQLTREVGQITPQTLSVSDGTMLLGGTLDLYSLVKGTKRDLVNFELPEKALGCSISGSILTSGDTPGTIEISVYAENYDEDGDGVPEYSGGKKTLQITIVPQQDQPPVEIVPPESAQNDQPDLSLSGGTQVTYGQTLQLGVTGGAGALDAQHAAVRVQFRDVSLLDRAQRLGRSRIATQDYQMATHGKKLQHSLAGKLIHHLEGARTVWRTGIVAQIHIVVLRQHLAQAMQDGQATISGIKDSDRSGIRWQNHFSFSSSTAVISSPISSLR